MNNPVITTCSANAPGKVILFGEHAVVYGYPAIAAPVFQARAFVTIETSAHANQPSINLDAPDIGIHQDYRDIPSGHPIRILLTTLLNHFGNPMIPAINIRIQSQIPIAAGMGSGAAISIALIKAFSCFIGQTLTIEEISALAYEIEKIYHGNPSGIDNTVISYERPIYFQRGMPFHPLDVTLPFNLLIADTGVKKETARVVAEVRRRWEMHPDFYNDCFARIGEIATQASHSIENGEIDRLGILMNQNHQILKLLGVSSLENETLVEAALENGALGAKVSGGGMGGNIIVLTGDGKEADLEAKLLQAGAVRTILTTIENPGGAD